MVELKQLVDGVRFIEKGLKNGVDKNIAADQRKGTKILFSRSGFYTKKMNKGEIFNEDCYAMKKPGGGMTSSSLKQLIGRTLKVNKNFDDFVSSEDFV